MEEVQDLLVFQQTNTPEGQKFLVWKVPMVEFEDLVMRFAETLDLAESRKWALNHFVMSGAATLIAVTEQDAALFAANLRECGLKAKYVK